MGIKSHKQKIHPFYPISHNSIQLEKDAHSSHEGLLIQIAVGNHLSWWIFSCLCFLFATDRFSGWDQSIHTAFFHCHFSISMAIDALCASIYSFYTACSVRSIINSKILASTCFAKLVIGYGFDSLLCTALNCVQLSAWIPI